MYLKILSEEELHSIYKNAPTKETLLKKCPKTPRISDFSILTGGITIDTIPVDCGYGYGTIPQEACCFATSDSVDHSITDTLIPALIFEPDENELFKEIISTAKTARGLLTVKFGKYPIKLVRMHKYSKIINMDPSSLPILGGEYYTINDANANFIESYKPVQLPTYKSKNTTFVRVPYFAGDLCDGYITSEKACYIPSAAIIGEMRTCYITNETAFVEISQIPWIVDIENRRLIPKVGLIAGIPYEYRHVFLEQMLRDILQSTPLAQHLEKPVPKTMRRVRKQ